MIIKKLKISTLLYGVFVITAGCLNPDSKSKGIIPKVFVVKDWYGRSHLITPDANSVRSLKEKINDKLGYPVKNQKLMLNGKSLDRTLVHSDLSSLENYTPLEINSELKGGGGGNACQAPNIDESSKKVSKLVGGLPSWTSNKKGLNIAIKCTNPNCDSSNSKYYVWIPKGTGKFVASDLNLDGYRCTSCKRLIENPECVKGYSFVNCKYTIRGRKVKVENREDRLEKDNIEVVNFTLQTSEDGSAENYISQKWTWWLHMRIMVE